MALAQRSPRPAGSRYALSERDDFLSCGVHMAKMVEVRLHGFTCEFAGDEGDDLEVTGIFKVLTFDDSSNIKTTEVLFDFPDGPIRMHKGSSVAMPRDVRVLLATPSVDPPGFGALFVKFGGDLAEKDASPDTDDSLGGQWETLHSSDVSNSEPRMWHFYFGRNEQIVRADLSIVFVHPV